MMTVCHFLTMLVVAFRSAPSLSPFALMMTPTTEVSACLQDLVLAASIPAVMEGWVGPAGGLGSSLGALTTAQVLVAYHQPYRQAYRQASAGLL
jgi:hypothetical protein